MNTRLANHFIRQLRRERAREVTGLAAERDFLMADERSVNGHHVTVFGLGPNCETQSIPTMMRELKRAVGAGAGIGRHPDDENTDFDWHDHGIRAEQSAREDKPASEQKHAATDRSSKMAAPELVKLFRSAAAPLQAIEVATALMVAKSLSSDDVTAKFNAVLKQPQPVIVVKSDAKGFIKPFLSLLKRGILLPGKVALSDGARSYLDGENDAAATRWHAVHFKIEQDGHKFEARDIYRVARYPLPLLVIRESPATTPPLVECAAHIQLDCGSLTVDVVRRTMHVVLGNVPDKDTIFPQIEHLDLPDLALAIRPGVSVDQALKILNRLVSHALSDVDRMQRRKGTQKDETASKNGSSSILGKRGNKSSGSEIIQPVRINESKSFVPTLATLSGFGDAHQWAFNLQSDLALWHEKELPWADMSTKLLLSGPPGTGKTSFARALCNSLQVPLVATSVATWLEPGYMGDCLSRMSMAFEEARNHAPCILFVDEFDGIGARGRSQHHDDYWTSIINRLLELLDGASRSEGVVVVAATNNPSVIDPALLRSGRLEKHITIPMPNIDTLTGIIKHHLGKDLDGVVSTAPQTAVPALGEEPSAGSSNAEAVTMNETVGACL